MKLAKAAAIVELVTPKRSRVRGTRIGSIVGREGATVRVDYPGNPHGPLPALSTVPLGRNADPGQVVLAFVDEASDQPVILGVLRGAGGMDVPAPPEPPSDAPIEARVDGRRVVIEAQDEIELRCGRARITLRRNGRVVIRGTYVETDAEGVNRLKGGTIKMN